MKTPISRRSILKKTLKGALGLAAVSFIAPALSSCKKKAPPEADLNAKQDDKGCSGQESLNEDQRALRNNLKYVDHTPIPSRTCDNCKLYTNPEPGSFCGGCKILPGPVHPKGHCISWYARM